MDIDLAYLPDDTSELQNIIVANSEKFEKLEEEIHFLKERIRLYENELFGRKTEKKVYTHPDQLLMFETEDEEPDDDKTETISVPEHQRKKKGRKPLPKDLPRVDNVIEIPDEENICGCGIVRSVVGQEVSEKLHYKPAELWVERQIRLKYACKTCEGVEDEGPAVLIAPNPPQLIPKANVTASLLTHIVVSKFADSLPLYRQSKMFGRLGIDLSRSVMSKWIVRVGLQLVVLMEMLRNEIRGGPIIQIDETPLQVMNEPNRHNTQKSYMWVMRGGSSDQPVILYEYHPTRSGRIVLEFLEDYHGYIQSDDYSGYDHLGKKSHITHLGCWSHARRKFVKVVKIRKKDRGKSAFKKGLADEALDFIRELYKIEKLCADLTSEQIYQIRQEQAKPVLNRFKKWLDAKAPLTPPKGLLGKAISYALNNWKKLIVYIEDGRLKPDNNLAENAIRPFVLGRKNWLFNGSPDGATASAVFFSLIETAKANGLEPYAYINHIFKKLPTAQTQSDFEKLLPMNVKKELGA